MGFSPRLTTYQGSPMTRPHRVWPWVVMGILLGYLSGRAQEPASPFCLAPIAQHPSTEKL